MKKKLALLLATVMTAATFGNVYADTASVKLQLNGKALESDQPPVIDNGRTMVPVRVVAEALGCAVDWDAETKTASFTRNGITAKLTIGEDILTITAGSKVQEIKIDTPAQIMNSRTMVPIRFLSESFGCKVEWDADTKTVNVISKLIEDALTSPSAVEVVTTPSAVEIKTAAEKLDAGIGVINKYVDKLSDEDKETFYKISYGVATILKSLSFSNVSDEILEQTEKATEEVEGKLSAMAAKYDFAKEYAEAVK